MSAFLQALFCIVFLMSPLLAAEKIYLIRHKPDQSFTDVADWQEIVFEKISKTTEYTPVKFNRRLPCVRRLMVVLQVGCGKGM